MKTIKLNAIARLATYAALDNKLKNSVKNALHAKGIDAERQGDSAFMLHGASLSDVKAALEAAGWEDNPKYREFEKEGEEYTLAYTASGNAVKLEFTYMG